MNIFYDGKEAKLPDFLIVGAAKSGTTSLHYYLRQHPQIFMPKLKELWFFCFLDATVSYLKNLRWKDRVVSGFDDYIWHFRDANENLVIGEACPSYLYMYSTTIRNIKKVYLEKYKDLKIIIILRNPAERAWSHFMMQRRDNLEPLNDFREVLKPASLKHRLTEDMKLDFDYIGWGMYFEQVKAFIEEFRDVKVVLFEELSHDSVKTVKEIYRFLNVDIEFIPDMKIQYNISGNVRFRLLEDLFVKKYVLREVVKSLLPYDLRKKIRYKVQEKNVQRQQMPADIKVKLIEHYYYDDILRLQKLINRDLSSWITKS